MGIHNTSRPTRSRGKIRTLNLRLLRDGKAPQSAFTSSYAPGGKRALEVYDWKVEGGGQLFIGQIYSKPPDWIDFLQTDDADFHDRLNTAGAGAVLFLPIKNRHFAVCFGHVHLALNDDAFERQFGLRVTLNKVPRGQLRSLDLATPDAITFQKRIQASKNSDLQKFGVDIFRDLARVAGGTPTDRDFARYVAGKDALSITCEVEASSLRGKCDEILGAYQETAYRQDFGWIDNMRRVVEKDDLEKLDEKLFDALNQLRRGQAVELHLAPPEIVNYNDGGLLHYNGFGSHGTEFHSLSIEDYVKELERCQFKGRISDIKERHKVRAQGAGSDDFHEKWKVYDCFVFETKLDDDSSHYVIFGGEWFRVEENFKLEVEEFWRNIRQVSIIGPTTCLTEEKLIAELDASHNNLLKLDQVKINPGGETYANLEPCDFFSDKKEFIHLKDGHSSAPISHLWSQGVVSAEAFVSDAEFRKKLRATVKSRKPGFEVHLPKSTDRVVREEYTVVYGIMRKPYAGGTIGLPFFSKVSLRTAAQRIRQLGISIAVELIKKPPSQIGGTAEGEAD